MRKSLWWMLCVTGVGVIAAAILIPFNFWNSAWWRELEAAWGRLADRRGWGVGFRETFMLVGQAAGATIVIGGLSGYLFGRRGRTAGPRPGVPAARLAPGGAGQTGD